MLITLKWIFKNLSRHSMRMFGWLNNIVIESPWTKAKVELPHLCRIYSSYSLRSSNSSSGRCSQLSPHTPHEFKTRSDSKAYQFQDTQQEGKKENRTPIPKSTNPKMKCNLSFHQSNCIDPNKNRAKRRRTDCSRQRSRAKRRRTDCSRQRSKKPNWT